MFKQHLDALELSVDASVMKYGQSGVIDGTDVGQWRTLADNNNTTPVAPTPIRSQSTWSLIGVCAARPWHRG